MVTEDDILDAFEYLRSVGLKKVPPYTDAPGWLRVLRDVEADDFKAAVDYYLRTPQEDSKGRMRGATWCPTAPELRRIAFDQQETKRHIVQDVQRGCARCGETLREDGTVDSHGTGFRTITQHSHPVEDDGTVRWDWPPYRIASRSVLCDCTKGRLIKAKQSGGDSGSTLTVDEALQRFQRADSRLYVTGTDYRYHRHDRHPRSPFYSRPSPEEQPLYTPASTPHGAPVPDIAGAAEIRASVYRVARGEVDPAQHVRQIVGQIGARRARLRREQAAGGAA